MIVGLLTALALSFDSFIAMLFIGPFLDTKKKWIFATLLGLVDELAYLLGMTFPFAYGTIFFAGLIVLLTLAFTYASKNRAREITTVALLLGIDNLANGLTRATYLSSHGLLVKCITNGTLLAHAFSLGLSSFAMAAIGIVLVSTVVSISRFKNRMIA